MALHNFIRESHIADKDFDRCDRDEKYVPPETSTSQPPTRSTRARDKDRNMNAFRDQIANGLFYRS